MDNKKLEVTAQNSAQWNLYIDESKNAIQIQADWWASLLEDYRSYGNSIAALTKISYALLQEHGGEYTFSEEELQNVSGVRVDSVVNDDGSITVRSRILEEDEDSN